MIERTVEPESSGRRLDGLIREFAELSQKQARRLCALGAVSIDGVRRDGTTRVRSGQVIRFDEALAQWSLRLGVPVVFADEDVMVLHKPPGLAVHNGPLIETSVATWLQAALPKSGLAHRLDRDASGLMLIGVTTEALRRLGAAMEQGSIRRRYEAVAVGELPEDSIKIDLPLLVTDEPLGDRPKTIVSESGQPSVSRVTVLGRRAGFSHVRVDLETGRTHQIRAHLRAIGHPLLGDDRYGDQATNDKARETFGVQRTLLHAAELRFPKPSDGHEVTARAVAEPDFARLFRPR